jgi:hypothetical protein
MCFLEKITQRVGRIPPRRARVWTIAQASAETLDGEREQCFCRRLVPRGTHQLMHRGNQPVQAPVSDRRGVDGRPGQPGGQQLRLQVEHPFTEAARPGRGAVVRHPGRQHGDQLTERAALVPVQVVADRAVVDQQDGPGVVGVHRVRVLTEPGVQDLGDPVQRRPPGSDPGPAGHVKIVQDLLVAAGRR